MTDVHQLPQFDTVAVGQTIRRVQTVKLETGLFGFGGSLREVYDELDAAWLNELEKRGIVATNTTGIIFWNRFVGLDEDGDEISELFFEYQISELTAPEPVQVAQIAGFPWLVLGLASIAGLFFFGGVALLDSSTELLDSGFGDVVDSAGKTARTLAIVAVFAFLVFTLNKP